jgi:DNA-binding transcriptional ArsR family regulator
VVRATPLAQLELSLGRVFGEGPRPESAAGLLDRPAESLAAIAAELLDCHDRLIGPHWQRMRAVLDADIAYRAGGALASGGARSLFNDLHPQLRWSDGQLTLTDSSDVRPSRKAVLGPDGLVLVPSVFIWPGVSMKPSTTTQTTVRYPARGSATVWETAVRETAVRDAGTPSLTATEDLLGAPRARLLTALRSPATPGSLALRLGVTRSAVSQHLRVLYRSGLVDRQRSGRQVLYWTSELGLVLLSRARSG